YELSPDHESFWLQGPGGANMPVPDRDFTVHDLAPQPITATWAAEGRNVAGKALFSLFFTSPGFPGTGKWAQIFYDPTGPALTALAADAPAEKAPAFALKPGRQSAIAAPPPAGS
ncbi:hypothetical protein ACWGKU_06320, partial [Kitasatospora sp. NPDC054768]